MPAKLTTNENAEPTANKDAEPAANEDAKPLTNQDIAQTSTSSNNVDAPHHEDDSPKNEDATGCLCKAESSLVCHM